MVHVLVDGITSLETVGLRSVAIIVDQSLGFTGVGHNDLSVLTHGNRSCLARCNEVVEPGLIFGRRKAVLLAIVLQVVVGVLVDALVAESVDGTQRVVDLHTYGIGAACGGIPSSSVDALQHALVHLLEQVGVLGDVEAEVSRELSNLHELLGIEVQFPSFVGHSSHISVGNG